MRKRVLDAMLLVVPEIAVPLSEQPMSRSCVCGGENENCRYCGGSGIIGDRLGSALDDTLRRATIENSPTADIKAEHARWPSWSQISVPPPIRWAKCPKGCGRWI